jgi:hypothetical protein
MKLIPASASEMKVTGRDDVMLSMSAAGVANEVIVMVLLVVWPMADVKIMCDSG